MAIFESLKGTVARWLGIVPTVNAIELTIQENTTKELSTLKNQLWYRGDPSELEQFYKKLSESILNSYTTSHKTRFWSATPIDNKLIRKMHSGLPRMIVDKLAAIVTNDMNKPEMDPGIKSRWDEIADDVDFTELLKKAVVEVLSEGDGAFKVCVDPELSKLPLLEFYSGNSWEPIYRRGKLVEIIYYTDYFKGTAHYRLREAYGKNYVRYALMDGNSKPVPLQTLPETENLLDVTFTGDFIMGVSFKVYDNPKFVNRGDSVYAGKDDMFDALDECISTWIDNLRANRVKQYIPESLIPRDENNGTLMTPDVFNPYILKSASLMEDAKNQIDVVQGNMETDGLLATYTTLLDCCLQGLISPSTLGIDVKKLDNAESQREKEKTTMYTRDDIIKALSKVLPALVEVVLKTQDTMLQQTPADKYESTWEWGQYANPSFEAMVETIGKAKTQGIMSIEQCVEELYGDTMSDEDKAAEVARLKEEQNPTLEVDQPAANDGLVKNKAQELQKDMMGNVL